MRKTQAQPQPVLLNDKQGRPYSLRLCSGVEEETAAILEMYRCFEPKECAQGLPPRAEARRKEWLGRLLGDRLNLVAVLDGVVIGHAVLLDMEPGRRGEYLVFVHQDHQDRGIGTELTRFVKTLAEELGYARVWLTVEAKNLRAIHVYRKTGFCQLGAVDSELEMEVDFERKKGS